MKHIIGNWKMNPSSVEEAEGLAIKISAISVPEGVEVGIAPPFVFLKNVKASAVDSISVWAQDVFFENPLAGGGAYTGGISAKMLKGLGMNGVIVGHSERRNYFKETDEEIAKKIKAVLDSDMRVILCVGEKKKGLFSLGKILKQVRNGLFLANKEMAKKIIIAYEPIWAIGTGQSAFPKYAEKVCKKIKKETEKIFGVALPILYGGSVNSENSSGFLAEKSIDGLLIGGASLKPSEMEGIIKGTINN